MQLSNSLLNNDIPRRYSVTRNNIFTGVVWFDD